jgi:AraC family transcriptional regulator
MSTSVRSFFGGEIIVRKSSGPRRCEPHLIPTMPLHNLVLLGQTSTTVDRLDGGATQWRELAVEPGEFHFCPAGTAGTYVGWRSRKLSGPEYLQVLIDPRRLVHAAGENGGHTSAALECRDKLRHPLLEQLVRTMTESASRSNIADELLIDATAEVIAIVLARDFVAGSRAPAARRERTLSARIVQQIADYIDSHLAETVRVSDLSKIVGLSSFHFSRAFKASTGQSPYAFALTRRVLRARQLLSTEMPLADIALAVGFASQSHLTEHFRRVLGITPGRIRREKPHQGTDDESASKR